MPSDSVWPLLLFLVGLFGFAMLILVCGIQSRELERGASDTDSTSLAPAPTRSLFATLDAAFEVPRDVDESVIQGVEQYLRGQTEVATRFVARPSIDSLHVAGPAHVSEPEPASFARIRRFLDRELELVDRFVSDPSYDRFHGQLATVA
ncbi:MAG: hypothetical protein HZB39_11085 [Planctomycetes bacterium]|nr:hypothetical protein [Planctomycetota bacterium]